MRAVIKKNELFVDFLLVNHWNTCSYCMGTLTRHPWLHYTVCWILILVN